MTMFLDSRLFTTIERHWLASERVFLEELGLLNHLGKLDPANVLLSERIERNSSVAKMQTAEGLRRLAHRALCSARAAPP